MDRFITEAFLGGTWQKTENTFAVHSPIDGAHLTDVADCSPEHGKQAIEAALTAFKTWSKMSGYERGKILRKWFDLINQNTETIARMMSLEMGKPITEALGENVFGNAFVEYYADEASRIGGDVLPSRFPHKRQMARYEAVGVVYAVTPWNYPMSMITRKAAPALAAGCTIIIKPAEQSPVTALLLAELWQQAGGPEGTLQILPTSDPVPITQVMMADKRVRKITFTGSTAVGQLLYKQAADTMKRVSLELGGHAPFIIFEDADLEATAMMLFNCKFRNAGQTCVSTNRVYAQRSIMDKFAQIFGDFARNLKLGNPLERDTQVGPLVDAQGLAKVQDHVQDAISKGAVVVSGGNNVKGLYFEPTVLTNISQSMKIVEEETFGPVAPIIAFDSEEEVLELANNSNYGLAAYVCTKDLSRAFRMSEGLEYGIVGVNDGIPAAVAPQTPFGGYKYSGLGREGGRWGIEEFLEVKLVSFGI